MIFHIYFYESICSLSFEISIIHLHINVLLCFVVILVIVLLSLFFIGMFHVFVSDGVEIGFGFGVIFL